MERFKDVNQELEGNLDPAFQEWHTDTQIFIVRTLGEADLARWRSEIGVQESIVPMKMDFTKAGRYRVLCCRVARLHELIEAMRDL